MARDQVPLTAADVARATSGRLIAGDAARSFDGVSIDSRTIRSGQLFIGIRGERFDGADYAAASVEAGATGVLLARSASSTRELAAHVRNPVVIEADDTTEALQALGRHVRRVSGTRVIAITGSVGKTTTKEIAADFLAARYDVYRNPGNLNNHIGLPLSLIELRSRPEMAVVELGMNHAGEISRLVALAEPETRVWTNVGDAHIGFFGSPEAIADAKAEVLEGATAATVVIANADDTRVMSRVGSFPGRVVTFGTREGADVRATNVNDRGIDGTSAHVSTPSGEADVQIPLVGEGNLANVLAAAAVALTWDVPLQAVIERAARLRPAKRRGEVRVLREGVTLVDDSYNSSPAALKRALASVSRDTRHARRIALLGEMLELGQHADRLHEECGAFAASGGLAALVAVGGAAARRMVEGAQRAGMSRGALRYYRTAEEAAADVQTLVQAGDLVLVKGSRGTRMDVVADRVVDEWR